jgi:hypothetical protein
MGGERMSPSRLKVDQEAVPCSLPVDATLASAFVYLRDQVLREGKIITEVRIDDELVTWEDGSPSWSALLTGEHELSLATDYPIRITGPLLARLAETLPAVADRHREWAEKLRQQDPSAPQGTADLLLVWEELQQALDQVCQLHGLSLDQEPWAGLASSFRGCFERLAQMLRELQESLELRDMVLSADLLDFELAPLAQEFVDPCLKFREALERHHPARPA